jgi:F-type H+-transporting ATPase subunit b
MDQILNQLGELVLGAVPTMILFILLVAAYGFLVRRPLDRVLAERRARTSGAVEHARGAISKAESETAAYEERLRAAKAEIFQARDQKLKQWNAEREAALAQVRQHTQERVRGARQDIEQSAHDARLQIVGMGDELSSRVLKAVLPAGVVAPTEVAQ